MSGVLRIQAQYHCPATTPPTRHPRKLCGLIRWIATIGILDAAYMVCNTTDFQCERRWWKCTIKMATTTTSSSSTTVATGCNCSWPTATRGSCSLWSSMRWVLINIPFPKKCNNSCLLGFLLLSSARPCPNTCSVCKRCFFSARVSSARHIQSLQAGEELATYILLFWPCGTAGSADPARN